MMISERKKLPNGWRWVALQDVASLERGKFSPRPRNDPRYYRGAYPWIQTGDVETADKYIKTYRNTLNELGLAVSKMFPKGTLIITIAATIGAVGILTFDSCMPDSLVAITPKEGVSDTEFLYYLLLFLRKEVKAKATQSAQANINLELLEPIEIPLPPLAEQKRIAAIAQKADRLRRTRRYALQLSDTYLRSVFLEMFGNPATNPKSWDCATIDDVVALSQYGTSEKSNSEKRGYPVLGMGNITYSGHIDLTSVSYVELYEKEFSELKLVPGDIIFNRTNSTELVGKTAHWNYNIDAVLASYLVKLKLKKEVLPDYFVAFLNSKYFKQLLQERCKKAIGQSNISPTLLKEFPMLVPPLPLQEKFAQIVQKFDRLRTQQREADRQAEHLFQTILHRAFRGELTSQNADDEPESVLLEEIRAQQAKAKAEAKTATQVMGDAAGYLGTKAKQQDIEPIQLKFPGFE
ncbi:restriction endonuclease subunit S [Microcoleus sp. F8-D3]